MGVHEIDQEIRAVQEVELEILIEFDKICRGNNLTYFIESGSVLGAVRHGGFIPWDDDIDVGMPRPDYEKFLEIGQNLLGEKYFLQNRITDSNAPFSYSKIRKNNTTFLEWNKRNIKMHHGIYIDIFPYDGLPEHKIDKHLDKCLRLNKLQFKKTIPDRVGIPQDTIKWKIGAAARRLQYYTMKLYPSSILDRNIDKEYKRYKLNVTGAGNCTCFGFADRLIFPNHMLFPTKLIMFEGIEFYGPAEVEEYLTFLYGDYMQFPPEEQRYGHRPIKISTKEEFFKR